MLKKKGIKCNISFLCSMLGILACSILLVYCFQIGMFQSLEVFQETIHKFGIFTPIAFIVVQIIQVIIPIIPGGVSCVAGVLMFGGLWGFIYNWFWEMDRKERNWTCSGASENIVKGREDSFCVKYKRM